MKIFKELKNQRDLYEKTIKSYNVKKDVSLKEFNKNIERIDKSISNVRENIDKIDDAISFFKNFKKEDIKDICSSYYFYDKLQFTSNDLSKATNFNIIYDDNYIGGHVNITLYYTISYDEISYKVLCFNEYVYNISRDGFTYYKFENLNKKIEKRFYTQYKKIVTKAILKNFDDIKISSHSEFYEDYLELKKLRIFK